MRRSPLSHSLAVLRTTIGLTQKQMGDLVNRAARTIQSIELKKLPLTEELALRIADATGVDEGWLFAGNPDTPPRKGVTLILAGRGEVGYTKADYEYYRAYVDAGFWNAEEREAIRAKAKAEGKLAELDELHLRKVMLLDNQLEVIKLIDDVLKNELAVILLQTHLSDHMRLVRWKIRRYFEELAREFSLDIPKRDIASQALKLATPLAHSNPNSQVP